MTAIGIIPSFPVMVINRKVIRFINSINAYHLDQYFDFDWIEFFSHKTSFDNMKRTQKFNNRKPMRFSNSPLFTIQTKHVAMNEIPKISALARVRSKGVLL